MTTRLQQIMDLESRNAELEIALIDVSVAVTAEGRNARSGRPAFAVVEEVLCGGREHEVAVHCERAGVQHYLCGRCNAFLGWSPI